MYKGTFLLLLIIVLGLLGCQKTEYSFCEKVEEYSQDVEFPAGYKYEFFVGHVLFQMTKSDLEFYEVNSRRRILRCNTPKFTNVVFKFPRGYSETKPTGIPLAILIGHKGVRLEHYSRPLKAARDMSSAINEHTGSLMQLSSETEKVPGSQFWYACTVCEPISGFPVLITDMARPIRTSGLDENGPVGPWDFRIQGPARVKPDSDVRLTYHLRLSSDDVEFEKLPTLLTDLEKQIKMWIKP